jgi:CHAD domain-containing protein
MKTDAHHAAAGARASPPGIGEALARLVAALSRMIGQGLSRKHGRHDGVHRARKAIRSLRAILALAGETLGEQAAPIDRSLQQLARSLSALRDAHVAVATARSLAVGDEAQAWLDVAARLHARSERQLAQELERDPGFRARRARHARMSKALAALPWDQVERRTLDRALIRSELCVTKAERKAKTRMTAARLHRWRRKVRRLRMQVDIMRRIEACNESLRKMQEERIGALKKCTDLLGRRQDLEVLAQLLPRVSDAASRAGLLRRLRQEIADLDSIA